MIWICLPEAEIFNRKNAKAQSDERKDVLLGKTLYHV